MKKDFLSCRRLRGLIQVAVSVFLLALILCQVRWAEVQEALWRMDLRWLALAWGLFLAGVAVRAVRWGVLLDALGVHRPLGALMTWYFVGGFFNVLLPTGFGGDAVRVVQLAQDTRRAGPALNTVLVDRYLGIMVLLAIGLAAGLVRPDAVPPAALKLTAGLFLAGLLAAWLVRRRWWPRWGRRADTLGRWICRLRLPVLAEAVRPYGCRALGRALAVSLAFNLLQIGWNLAIGQGLALRVPLIAYLTFVPLTSVALLLPAFGGLGVRELTYVGLFGSIGVPRASALALSLGVYVITVATGLVGGAMYLLGGVRRARGEK